jgi:hypothetical protein
MGMGIWALYMLSYLQKCFFSDIVALHGIIFFSGWVPRSLWQSWLLFSTLAWLNSMADACQISMDWRGALGRALFSCWKMVPFRARFALDAGMATKMGSSSLPLGGTNPNHAFSMMCHQLTVDYSYVFFIFFPQGSHRQLPMATWERLKPEKIMPVWWFTPLWYPWIHRLTVYEAPFLWENSNGIPLMYTLGY